MNRCEIIDVKDIAPKASGKSNYEDIYLQLQSCPLGKAVRVTVPEGDDRFVTKIRAALLCKGTFGKLVTRTSADRRFFYVWKIEQDQ